MDSEKKDLFFILLKLKSYLISLIDNAENCENEFKYSEEYLDRCFPEYKSEVINLLEENNIFGDCDIVFNDKVHLVFKKIAYENQPNINLESILQKFDINSQELINNQKKIEEYINERENRLKIILEILFHIAKEWSVHKEIESNVDSYSVLNDEDVIRPDEEIRLDNLDVNASISFERITNLTEKYLNNMAEYYFKYGGNLSLEKFIKYLELLKQNISLKYSDLLRENGLNNDINE